MHTRSVSRALTVLVLAPAVLWLGCGGGADLTGPPAGSLEITVATAGPEPDPDGYAVSLDGGTARAIAANGSLRLEELSVGAHAVDLSGLAANCSPSGGAHLDVEVAANAVAGASFAVACAATSGAIAVTTTTSGSPTDPDGYELTLDGGAGVAIGAAASLALPDLAPGTHAVGLTGISANCRLDGDNPRAVEVASGTVAPVAFAVACTPLPPATGSLALTTVTTGPNPDPDGYTVTLDGGSPQALGTAATATFDGLEPRAHSVQLGGLAANCQAQGQNPRNVTVAAGETVTTTFAVTCTATTGTLEITVAGLPAGTDAAVGVTGPRNFSASVGGTTALTGLAPGSYAVTAADVTAGGTRYTASPASRTIAVAANATARLTITYGPAAAATLNLRIDGLELIQSVQTPGGTVPLVGDRDGLVRVFVLANQTNTAAPSVRVRLFRNGTVVQTLTIAAPRGSTPTARNEGDLGASWNVKIPRTVFTPGLAVSAEVDPGNAVAESNETDNSYPASGTAQAETVRSVPEFALRFVPVRQQVSGAQGDVSEATRADFLRLTRRIYPIAGIDGDVHAVYTTSTTDALQPDDANGAWATILNEVDALRVAEGTSRTYYGVVHVEYPFGVAGLGYIGRPTAMGYDREVDQSRVMAHELGHTWNRLHSPCGQPTGVDPGYPYAGGTIGVYGFDLQDNALRSPSSPDVMGYCGDPWISDYTYAGVLDYRVATQAALARAAFSEAQPCLLVWGRIVNGRPVLEPAFEVVTRPSLPKSTWAVPRGGPSPPTGRASSSSRSMPRRWRTTGAAAVTSRSRSRSTGPRPDSSRHSGSRRRRVSRRRHG